MGDYRCLSCEHKCRINTGSLYGHPVKCIVDGKAVEWSKTIYISHKNSPCLNFSKSINKQGCL